jgi:hypothetical protein
VPRASTQTFCSENNTPRLRYYYSQITIWYQNRQTGAPATLLRVAVLSALQTIKYRPQSLIAGGLVLLHASGLTGELCYPAGKARAPLGGQDAPGECAVRSLQILCFAMSAFEQTFEGGVEGLGCLQGEL